MAIQALDFPSIPYQIEAGTMNVFGLPWYLSSPGYATQSTYGTVDALSVPYLSSLTPIKFGGGSTYPAYYPWLVTSGDGAVATATTGDVRGTITLYNVGNPIYPLASVPAPNGARPLNYLYYIPGCANNGLTTKQSRAATIGVPQYYERLPVGA